MHSNYAVDLDWLKETRPKLLVGCLAGLLFLFAIWAIGGFSSQDDYRDAIRAVIAQDKALSQDPRNSASIWELIVGLQPDKLDSVVEGMKKIDLRRCPKVFQRAYRKHIDAWVEYAGAQRADGHTRIALQHVELTWREVHSVAQQYGVDDAIQ